MKSTICLRCTGLPSLPLRIPSSVKPPKVTKSHFSFTLSSLPLTNSNSSIYRRLAHGFGPIVCAINRLSKPSMNDEGDDQILRGAVGASLALACVLGIITCGCKSPKAIASTMKGQKSPPPMAITYPLGGKVPLKSLLDMTVYLSSSKEKRKKLPVYKRPSKAEVDEIKVYAMWQVRSGKGEEALKLLRKKVDENEGDPEVKFNLEMALVEVLICLGRYEEASKCSCLPEFYHGPSDGRIPLYKAIICTMSDDKENAKKWWKEYVRAVDGGITLTE